MKNRNFIVNAHAAAAFNSQPNTNTQAEIIHDTEIHSPMRTQQETLLIYSSIKS